MRKFSLHDRAEYFDHMVRSDEIIKGHIGKIQDSSFYKTFGSFGINSFIGKVEYLGFAKDKVHDSTALNPMVTKNIEDALGDKALADVMAGAGAIKDRLEQLFEDERKYLKTVTTTRVVLIRKSSWNSYINVDLCDIDFDNNEIIRYVESNGRPWDSRGDITEIMLDLNKKYGITEYISEDYEPTVKARKVFTEFKAA